jgi:serine/threonine protein kinase
MRVQLSGRVPVSVLNQKYGKRVKFLGHGSFGIAFLVWVKEKSVAVKIQEYDGAGEQEIEMFQKLNPISPVFTKAYQCFLCNALPQHWVKEGKREAEGLMEYFLKDRVEPYLLIEMEYIPYMFLNAPIPTSQRRRFVYKLFEAIKIARQTLGVFALNDIHKGNIMCTSKWEPRIIDFGFASTSEDILDEEEQFCSYIDSGGHQAPKNDFIRLEILFKQKGWDFVDLTKVKQAKADDWEVIDELLSQLRALTQ